MITDATGRHLLEAMESLWLLARQAERTIRETGHQPGCPQCPCGASKQFTRERVEFYRQWRTLKEMLDREGSPGVG